MNDFQTSYYKFDSPSDEDQTTNEDAYLMHVPDRNKAQWHHIEDLDGFFVRVYQYHQNHGFTCIFMQQCFELLQFLFVVMFASFLFVCVDYDILFANKLPPGFNASIPEKVTLADAICTSQSCAARVSQHGMLMFFIVLAAIFWTLRAVKVLFSIFRLLEIAKFYKVALHIKQCDIDNLTWHEVQQRLMLVQEEQQMCIHKQQLTELDVYNRILRFKNYMVSLVNKGLIPPRFNLPFIGETVFFTQGLKYNLELILFWSPRAIFANSYHMRDEFKQKSRREELARRLSGDLLCLGLLNLVLSPVIFLWQILYSFLSYAEVLKREPGSFGARRWSLFARLYLRHFNELPHEFQARLNRGYKPASSYMGTFTSPILTVFAKNIAFFVGSLLAVLLTLTVWDEDVLKVEHVLTAITLFSIVVTICKSFIPDEHAASCPEHLMRQVIAQVHYSPDSWRGQAHTYNVRDQFAQIFQFKGSYVLEELLSPIVTPFLLMFWMRSRSLEIVDFFRNFTVDIAGVGDVCSFAQLDVNKHGDPKWHEASRKEPSYSQQADDGKVELSLMHFAITNPKWTTTDDQGHFLNDLKVQAHKDAAAFNDANAIQQNPLLASLNSLGSVDMLPSMMNRANQSLLMSGYGEMVGTSQTRNKHTDLVSTATRERHRVTVFRGTKSNEGPVEGTSDHMVSSVLSGPSSLETGAHQANLLSRFASNNVPVAERLRNSAPVEMSISALYMHELHHQRMNDRHSRMMWETIPDDHDDEVKLSGVTERRSIIAGGSSQQQTYRATSSLTNAAIFGGSHLSQEDRAGFGSMRLEGTAGVSASQASLPFLDTDVTTATPPAHQQLQNEQQQMVTDRRLSSDSDASPPQFHLIEHAHVVQDSESGNQQDVDNLYRPPKV